MRPWLLWKVVAWGQYWNSRPKVSVSCLLSCVCHVRRDRHVVLLIMFVMFGARAWLTCLVLARPLIFFIFFKVYHIDAYILHNARTDKRDKRLPVWETVGFWLYSVVHCFVYIICSCYDWSIHIMWPSWRHIWSLLLAAHLYIRTLLQFVHIMHPKLLMFGHVKLLVHLVHPHYLCSWTSNLILIHLVHIRLYEHRFITSVYPMNPCLYWSV